MVTMDVVHPVPTNLRFVLGGADVKWHNHILVGPIPRIQWSNYPSCASHRTGIFLRIKGGFPRLYYAMQPSSWIKLREGCYCEHCSRASKSIRCLKLSEEIHTRIWARLPKRVRCCRLVPLEWCRDVPLAYPLQIHNQWRIPEPKQSSSRWSYPSSLDWSWTERCYCYVHIYSHRCN